MRIRVLYFAVVRERLRRDQEAVELAPGSTLGALLDELSLRHPELSSLRPHLQVSRNQVLARPETMLSDGDEVALIPPVSGGAGEPVGPLAAIREAPLDLLEVVRAVTDEGAGGIATFTGVVRRRSRGRTVERLEYEAYRGMAEAKLAEIARALEAKHGARLAILHRVGTLAVGEVAVVIAAAAPHREAAFAACRDAIERLKAEAPIWKKEIGDDGEEWIGMGP